MTKINKTTETRKLIKLLAIQRNIYACKTIEQLNGCRDWITNFEKEFGAAAKKSAANLRRMASGQELMIKSKLSLLNII